MDKEEMFEIIKDELHAINKKIDKLFSKQDDLNERVIRNEERIKIIWKFVIGSIFSGIIAFITAVVGYFVKQGGK